jgi:hypothetical protein
VSNPIVRRTAKEIIELKRAEQERLKEQHQATLSSRKDPRTPSHNCPDIEIAPIRRFHTDHSLTTLMNCGCSHSSYTENGYRNGYTRLCLAHSTMTIEVHQFIKEFCEYTNEEWVKQNGLRGGDATA